MHCALYIPQHLINMHLYTYIYSPSWHYSLHFLLSLKRNLYCMCMLFVVSALCLIYPPAPDQHASVHLHILSVMALVPAFSPLPEKKPLLQCVLFVVSALCLINPPAPDQHVSVHLHILLFSDSLWGRPWQHVVIKRSVVNSSRIVPMAAMVDRTI